MLVFGGLGGFAIGRILSEAQHCHHEEDKQNFTTARSFCPEP